MFNVRGLTSIGVLAAQALLLGQPADMNKVVADARSALGGEKKLAAVKTITVTGKAQRTNAAGASVEQDFEMAMELPDKFMRRDVIANLGNMSAYRISGFNGDGLINEIDQPPQLAGGGNMVLRMQFGSGGAGTQLTPEQQAALKRAQLLDVKQDFARLTLGIFAQSFPSYPLTMAHVGQAESPDGKADVIELKGEGDFTARLFIDAQSHLPLMISWMAREPLTRIITRGGPGDPAGRAARGGQPPTPEEREKMIKEMQEEAKKAQAERKMVEFRLFYMDYKEVDGVKVPHKLQRTVDGKPAEEITFDRVRFNQKIDPKKFEVSK